MIDRILIFCSGICCFGGAVMCYCCPEVMDKNTVNSLILGGIASILIFTWGKSKK